MELKVFINRWVKYRVIVLGFIAMLVPSVVSADILNVYAFRGALAQETIDNFEAKTGITVAQSFYTSPFERSLALFLETKRSRFDLVLLEANELAFLHTKGIVQQISPPNAYAISDSCKHVGIDYIKTRIGVAYRRSKVNHIPESWRLFFDAKTVKSGSIIIPAGSYIGLGVVLQALEEERINEQNITTIRRFFDVLPPFKVTPGGSLSTVDDLSSIAMAPEIEASFNGLKAQQVLDDDWAFIAPNGMSKPFMVCWGLSSVSANPRQAKLLLDYISRPEVAALNAELTGVQSIYTASQKTQKNTEPLANITDQERRLRAWLSFSLVADAKSNER